MKWGATERLKRSVGLDFHVLNTLMFRGWTVLAGAVTLLVLPLWLSPVQQGYYYTFASVLAIQVFFELGLGQVLVQLVGREVAHLHVTAEGLLAGDPRPLDRLASLVRLVRRWYGTAALLFFVSGATVGGLFFRHKGTLPISEWMGAWLLVVLASAMNLYLSPRLAVLEGMGRVGNVARLRFSQALVGYLGLWAALMLGAALWAAAIVPLVTAACTHIWLRQRGAVLSALAARPVDHTNRLRWRHDVFPFQWRISFSWVSGYFIFNLFTPLVFSRAGPVEAGRLGIGIAIINAIATIGMSWVSARSPNFAMHVARNERTQLDALFKAVALRSTLVTSLLCIAVVGVVWSLNVLGVPAASRIAAPSVLACLAWAAIVNSVVYASAVYMRAHCEEPLLAVSLVTAALVATMAWFTSPHGVLPMMFGYAIVTTCVALPWTLALLKQYAQRTR